MCYHKRWYCFFLKIWYYFLDGKWKIIFFKKKKERKKIRTWKYDVFCIFGKKSLLSQIRIGTTIVINVNNTSNKFVIINLPSLVCQNLISTISIFTPFSRWRLFVTKKLILQLFHNWPIISFSNKSYKCSASLIIQKSAASRITIYLRHVLGTAIRKKSKFREKQVNHIMKKVYALSPVKFYRHWSYRTKLNAVSNIYNY